MSTIKILILLLIMLVFYFTSCIILVCTGDYMNKKTKPFLILIIIFTVFSFISCKRKQAETAPKVMYVKVLSNWGPVNPAYTTYLETTFKDINEQKNVVAVIIEIDTPGGSVRDAEKIVKLISLLKPTTISYITNSAYSAGALLSLSTDYTVMSPNAKVGAMEPVMLNPKTKQMKTAPEKIISAMRASMRALAEKRRKRILNENKTITKKDINPEWIKNLPDIAAAMVDKNLELNKKQHGIDLKKGILLTLTSEEAKRVGFTDHIASNMKELLEKMNFTLYKLVEIRPKLKHVLISVLTNSWITMILLSLGTLGLIIEIKTPGWGIPGTFGVLALSVFFYANIVAGNASWEAPVLFILGLVLLGLEIFVIPGFGVVGIAGIISVFASFYTGMGVKFSNFWQAKQLLANASAIIFGAITISIGLAIIIFKFLPKTRLFPKIILTDAALGYKAHEDMSELAGKKGVTISALRPSGIAIIEDKRLDVVSRGEFIGKNEKIIVSEVDGARIVVTIDK